MFKEIYFFEKCIDLHNGRCIMIYIKKAANIVDLILIREVYYAWTTFKTGTAE